MRDADEDRSVARPGARVGGAHALNLRWLVRLRWVAVVGQAATIAGVHAMLPVRLPLAALAAVLALEAVSNVCAAAYARRATAPSEHAIGAVMAIDLLCLTSLFALTGGPFNPFNFLYLVHIALAAVVLRPRWVWTLSLLSIALFGLLFRVHRPLELPGRDASGNMAIHLEGMWVAFAVAALFIAGFVSRVARALARREADLAAARDRLARTERLASMATVAAGAAHELGTPLSTIAVAAKELERGLGAAGADSEMQADARLIREAVDRCRAVLDQLSADAGRSAGEAPGPLRLRVVLDDALRGLPGAGRVSIELPAGERAGTGFARALARALRGVLANALDASETDGHVEVRASIDATRLHIEVRDDGCGMSAETLARAGEPFFTTKARGMGLGLFVARGTVERMGGRVKIDSAPGAGTIVAIEVPMELGGAA